MSFSEEPDLGTPLEAGECEQAGFEILVETEEPLVVGGVQQQHHQTLSYDEFPQSGRGRGGRGGHGRTTSGGAVNTSSTSNRARVSTHHRAQQVDAQKLQTELHQLDSRLDRLRKEIELRRTLPQATEHRHITTAETLHSKQVVYGLQSRITADLCQLASENLYNALRAQLRLNVSANGKDLNGMTPLHLAAKHGHTKAVEVLLEFKASRNSLDEQGRRPVDIALHEGHSHLIDLLVVQSNAASPAVTTPSTVEPPAPTVGGMVINSGDAEFSNGSFGGMGTGGHGSGAAFIAGGNSGSFSGSGERRGGSPTERDNQPLLRSTGASSPPISMKHGGGGTLLPEGESYDGFSLGVYYGGDTPGAPIPSGGSGGGLTPPGSGAASRRQQQQAALTGSLREIPPGSILATSTKAPTMTGNPGRKPSPVPHPSNPSLSQQAAQGADTKSNASFTSSQQGTEGGNNSKPTVDHLGLALVMMGLPARGKSFVAKRIRQYFTWSGIACKIFSFRHYRKDRYQVDEHADRVPVTEQDDQICAGLCVDVNKFLKETQGIAIIDGTFSTKKRRETLVQWLKAETVCEAQDIVFLELVVNNAAVIDRHIQTAIRALEIENSKLAEKKKTSDKDEGVKKGAVTKARPQQPVDTVKFRQDYLDLIKSHVKVYETLDLKDELTSFIKVVDGETFFLNEIEGAVVTNVVYLLQNMHQHQNAIYMTCCGESESEVESRLGGNSKLTERGRCFSVALAEFMRSEMAGTTSNISPAFSPLPQQVVAHKQKLELSSHRSGAGSTTPPPTTASPAGSPSQAPMSPTSTQVAGSSGGSSKNGSPTKQDPASCLMAPRTIFSVIRSAQVRAIETASQIPLLCTGGGQFRVAMAEYPALDDINYGDCDGQTTDDVKATLPRTFARLLEDPYHNTWPNGESVRQLFQSRLEPLIHDIQSKDIPLLIISHKPLVQGLMCYFSESEPKPELAPTLGIDKDTVIRVTYRGVEHVDLSSRVDELMAVASLSVGSTGIPPTSRQRSESTQSQGSRGGPVSLDGGSFTEH